MKITLWVLAVLVLSAVGLAGYFGAFARVAVSEETFGPIRFVYRSVQTVDYREVARMSSEMDHMLSSIEVSNRAPLDVYFADGSAQIGFKVSDVELDMTLSNGTRVRSIPEQNFMAFSFPWRSPLSYLVGDVKAESAFKSHRKDHGYMKSETMTSHDGDSIIYLQPIRKN